MGLLNPGGPIAQFQRSNCSISPIEVISLSGVRILVAESDGLRLLLLSQQEKCPRIVAHSYQEDLLAKGRLFVSPRNPKRLVTADEFNAFLEDVCEEQGITDAYGKHTKITMYSLRHANGAEMASSAEFSREEFTRAFAHNSRYSDDSYSYASKHDELQATAPYTEAVHNVLTHSAADTSVAQPISSMRLTRMQSNPQTRLIGTTAVCQEKNCSSQFEYCISYDSFKPDPQYITEAEKCCELLEDRIERFRTAGDDDTLHFNERQLAAYTTFIQRVKSQ